MIATSLTKLLALFPFVGKVICVDLVKVGIAEFLGRWDVVFIVHVVRLFVPVNSDVIVIEVLLLEGLIAGLELANVDEDLGVCVVWLFCLTTGSDVGAASTFGKVGSDLLVVVLEILWE